MRRTTTFRCCSARSVTRRIEVRNACLRGCHVTHTTTIRPDTPSLEPARAETHSRGASERPTSPQPRLSWRNRRSATRAQRLRRRASLQGRLRGEDWRCRVVGARGVRAGRAHVCRGNRAAVRTRPGLPRPFAAALSTSSSASRSKTSGSTSRTGTASGLMPRRTVTRDRSPRKSPPGLAAGTLPPFIGIRIKPMSKELHARSLRTLDLFVTTLVARGGTAAAELCRDDSEAHGAGPCLGRRASVRDARAGAEAAGPERSRSSS